MRFQTLFSSAVFSQAGAILVVLASTLSAPSPGLAGEIPFVEVLEITQTFDRGRAVIAADIDGDGDLDVVGAAPSMANEVAWWENTAGDGSTWVKDSIDDALPNAVCVRAADLDGDGDIDLAAASLGDGTANSSKIIIYLNTNGDGSSWNPIVVDDTSLTGADAVAAADLDQDGDIDLLGGAMNDEDFLWFENTAGNASAWTARTIDAFFNGTRSIEVVDFDHDGDLDAVAAGEFEGDDEGEVAWFENPGPATIASALSWTRHKVNPSPFRRASAVCTADFDHDGDIDIAAVNDDTSTNPDTVVWFINSGDDLTFAVEIIEPSFSGAHGVHCADMDADGDVDIFAAARTEGPSPLGSATWWENRLDEAASWVEHDVDDSFGQARATWTGDIDTDGDLDALVIGDNDKIIYYANRSIHRNASFSTATAETLDADHQGASGVAIGDLDRDGDPDVVASAATEGRVDWYRNDGGTWTQSPIANALVGVRSVAVGDLDHDGDLDVAVAVDGAIDDVLWFANTAGDGTTWSTANTIDAAVPGASDVAIGDIDGDGHLDVAAAAFADEEFLYWSNTSGDGSTWAETSISAAASATHNGAIAVRLVDLDRDGDLDVLAGAETDDDALFLRNTSGDGSTWAEITIDGSADGINEVGSADLDGDGDLDAFGANEVADTVVWWRNTDGLGTTWSAALVVDAFHNGARAVEAADFDADGDMDLVATQAKDGGKVTWYENDDGLGGSFTEHDLITAFADAAALALGDVDHNGEIDVVAAAETANDVLFFPNYGGQFALDTTNTSPVTLGNSVTEDIFEIVARHNGLVGEPDVELRSFELLFEELEGDPLTSGEVEQVVENLFVYLDDGAGASPGAWDMADTVVTTVATLTLDADGILSVPFVKDDPNVAVTVGTPRTYFVVLETTSDYDTAGLTFFQVTHVTEASSTADDKLFDTPLRLEAMPNTTSNAFEVNSGGSTTADLVLLSITDSPDPVDAGAQVTYTVTVRNNGPWPALNVRATSTLPSDTSLVSTTGCAEDPSGSPTCTLGSISAGAEKSFTITLAVAGDATGPLTYSASVTSDTTEANPGDESDSETTSLQQPSNLVLKKGTSYNAHVAGSTIHYLVTVENTGAGDEPSVMVSDTFPSDFPSISWNCNATGGATCGASSGTGDLNETVSLPAGSRVTFSASGTLGGGASGTISNSASATGSLSSDSDSHDFQVSADPDDAPMFLDGFESGNTNGWSSSSGG